MNETMTIPEALTMIRLTFATDGGAITAISDFADDPQGYDATPELRAALETVCGDDRADFLDIGEICEYIGDHDAGFAAELAIRNELCPLHYSDPENCADEPEHA